MNPVKNFSPKNSTSNKRALKLIGIDNADLSGEEILERISVFVEPDSIEALVYDDFNCFYVLFVIDIESACRLVGKTLKLRTYEVLFLPLLDYYIIENVYPSLSHDELRDIFRAFGNVFSVSNHHLIPNSLKFSHVLSGKREISFLVPGRDCNIYIPANVIHSPYSFHVKKLCCACLTEGHSILKCPDIEDDNGVHDEVDAIIKAEDIYDQEEYKLEDMSPVSPSAEENMETVESVKDQSATSIDTTSKISGIEMQIVPSSAESIEAEQKNEDMPTKLCIPVSEQNSVASPVDTCVPDVSKHAIKTKKIWTPVAEDLINNTMNTVEANVLKHLLTFEGRQKTDIIEYTFSCLKDVSNLLKQLKLILQLCYEKKYSSLLGPFSRKIQTIISILSKYEK
ncbi:uncharacterized protein NPIL_176571 [Nephila pilipes]|uniref:Uncharacterized protein n=1 Tax=Nephila pilipes TaxID=299642 RepID=A0A8X6TTI5_NEPPI|nr:uncharacterized protein NPIL_176571 [Nephila pilipes]